MPDDDWGIPFPGEVVPAVQWSETALKRLPIGQPFSSVTLFGKELPLVVDLGCGNGRSTIGQALLHPNQGYIGLEILPLAIRYAVKRANHRGLTNVRFAVADAREVVQRLLAPGSIHEIHLYHPQPFYDLAEVHKRLINAEFLVNVHKALKPEGTFILQTDNPHYWNYIQQIVPHFFRFEELPGTWQDYPEGRSRREILARQQGLPIFRGIASPLASLNLNEVVPLASKLIPTFSADRKLQLDE